MSNISKIYTIEVGSINKILRVDKSNLNSFMDVTLDTGWTQYFDNNYWQPWANASWDSGNSRWELDLTGPTQAGLQVTGSWYLGYRPTKIRCTFTVSPSDTMTLHPAGEGVSMGVASPCSSLQEVSLSWSGVDIGKLYWNWNPSPNTTYYVTNIEFYLES